MLVMVVFSDKRSNEAVDGIGEMGIQLALRAGFLPLLLDGRPVHAYRPLRGGEASERMLGHEREIPARHRHGDALLVPDAVEEELLHVLGDRLRQVRPDISLGEQTLQQLFLEQRRLIFLKLVDCVEQVMDQLPGAHVETVEPECPDPAE